jgi:hypothetical protein
MILARTGHNGPDEYEDRARARAKAPLSRTSENDRRQGGRFRTGRSASALGRPKRTPAIAREASVAGVLPFARSSNASHEGAACCFPEKKQRASRDR